MSGRPAAPVLERGGWPADRQPARAYRSRLVRGQRAIRQCCGAAAPSRPLYIPDALFTGHFARCAGYPEPRCRPARKLADLRAKLSSLSRHPVADVDGLGVRRGVRIRRARSEEHTSELQSLMRISYAVFCLKKKKYKYTNR